MEKQLTWTKGLFESSYQLFENGEIKNSLFFATWGNEARSIGQEKTIFFKTASILDSTTQIVNEKAELLGTISFNILQTKAIVYLVDGTQYTCDFTTSWFNKWTVTDTKSQQIFYDADTSSGRITTNTDDELMLLSGLFFREYYNRTLMIFLIFMAVMMIIIS